MCIRDRYDVLQMTCVVLKAGIGVSTMSVNDAEPIGDLLRPKVPTKKKRKRRGSNSKSSSRKKKKPKLSVGDDDDDDDDGSTLTNTMRSSREERISELNASVRALISAKKEATVQDEKDREKEEEQRERDELSSLRGEQRDLGRDLCDLRQEKARLLELFEKYTTDRENEPNEENFPYIDSKLRETNNDLKQCKVQMNLFINQLNNVTQELLEAKEARQKQKEAQQKE